MEKRSVFVLHGCRPVENENRSISITMHKTQVQMDQKTQDKTNHTKPHKKRKWEVHLNALARRLLPTYYPSSTDTERNNKWDLLKLRNFCKAKDIVNKTK